MSLPDSLQGKRPTWVEVDLNRLESNFLALRNVLPRHIRIMAVIKADAYGHGAKPVALRLQQLGVDALAVAILEEALVLRKAGVTCPLLLLNGFWPDKRTTLFPKSSLLLSFVRTCCTAWRRRRSALSDRLPTIWK